MVSAAPLVVLGEVRTCLLPSSSALDRAETGELLALMPGRLVMWRERPGSLAISPPLAVGVDCDLALGGEASGDAHANPGTVHIVGTVATRAVLAGGSVLQSSGRTTVVRSETKRRQPWSHYISRRGITEVIGGVPERATITTALETEYLAGRTGPGILSMSSICARLLDRIRADPLLDQDPPVQTGNTRLRWTARIGRDAGPAATLHIDDDTTRSVRITLREESDIAAAQRFCEDLAAHDWLLTMLTRALAEADRYGTHSAERREVLTALLTHFTGLWMPGAHTPPALRTLWSPLQTDPGFTRQWNALTERIDAGVAVATLDALLNKHVDPNW